jgi:hypothetical protein
MDLQTYAKFLKEKGIIYTDRIRINFLEDRINTTLLKREEALQALDLLRGLKIIVMGGETYFKKDNYYEHHYGFWNYEATLDKSLEQHVEESNKIAVDFIKKYNEPNDKEIFYMITTLNEDLEDFEKRYKHYKETGEF